jgi:hypothetical protein
MSFKRKKGWKESENRRVIIPTRFMTAGGTMVKDCIIDTGTKHHFYQKIHNKEKYSN